VLAGLSLLGLPVEGLPALLDGLSVLLHHQVAAGAPFRKIDEQRLPTINNLNRLFSANYIDAESSLFWETAY
jgi:hypothetical protein